MKLGAGAKATELLRSLFSSISYNERQSLKCRKT
jgi:hypothetical protein